MIKHRIAFIIPYFGKFPNYFRLWEFSASQNPDFSFFIFTDSPKTSPYKNIYYIPYSLQKIKEQICGIAGFKVKLENAYKIVDYKPLYGLIFKDYIKDYTHWGYCDSDVIFGCLSNFITDDILTKYDRIYQHGHMCIYKNNDEINWRWKTKYNLYSYIYTEVFKVKGIKMFDERGCLWDLWKQNKWKQYLNDKDFADILPTTDQFTTPWAKNQQIYEYKDGKVIGHFLEQDKIKTQEFCYIHLQKRKMSDYVSDINNYFIIANEFINVNDKIENIFSNSYRQFKNIQTAPNYHTPLYKKIFSRCTQTDELIFHIKVFIRRCGYFMTGKNWHIKYKLF